MTDAATSYFAGASELQKRPITEPQWADAVEAYQRAKLMKEANVIRRADPRMSMTSDELAEKIAEAINGRAK